MAVHCGYSLTPQRYVTGSEKKGMLLAVDVVRNSLIA